jgi:transcriptional antiterminator RfaH
MTAQWYVLHSKPMKEALLWEQLNLHQIESYYPRIKVKPVNPRARKVRPYFPGYVFVHVDLEQTKLSTFQWMPGAASIVSFDGAPSPVPDNLVTAIQRRVDEINATHGRTPAGLKPGEVVIIQEGPFSGYEAIFDAQLSGEERVRVLLKYLNRGKLPLELPGSQIQRKPPHR